MKRILIYELVLWLIIICNLIQIKFTTILNIANQVNILFVLEVSQIVYRFVMHYSIILILARKFNFNITLETFKNSFFLKYITYYHNSY